MKLISWNVNGLRAIYKKGFMDAFKNLDADVVVECGDFITPILERKLKFDVLLCNPPYISKHEVIDDIVWNNEPHLALIPPSGDGIEMYKKLFKTLPKHLNDMAYIFFEIGCEQKQELTELIKKYLPNSYYCFHIDMMGKTRILEIRYSK